VVAARGLASIAPTVFLVAACDGGDDGPDPACTDHLGTVLTLDESTLARQGSVTIVDRDNRTFDEQKVPQSLSQGLIQASFFDISAGTSTPATFMQLSDVCLGRVSRAMPATGLVPLAAGALSVEGTSRGTVGAEEVNPGRYVHAGAKILGAGEMRIVAAGGGFPAFAESLDAADPMDLVEPPLDGSTLLELGELQIAWTPGDGDFVLIVIDPDEVMGAESGGDVVCALPDDGCHVLPASVAAFLLASRSSTYTLIVARHRIRALDLDATTHLELESVAEVRGTIVSGVSQ
jgi:hypothetical protein